MPLIATLMTALFITVVMIPYLMRYAGTLGLVDLPNERKVHSHSVPRIGGVAIVFAFLVPFVIWFPKTQEFAGIIAGVVLLFIFGVWDDRRDISYRLKFGGQLLAAVAVVAVGDIRIEWIPFHSQPLESVWISWALTIFCLLAITNAMNLADGLDGLAGGASILSFGLVGLLSYQSGSYPLVLTTCAVAGSILGFLRFNSHPARIFMGDTGSQFLGFILGVQVILLTQKVNTAMSSALPLLILGLPVIDTASVMIRRIVTGRSPFSPDKNHIHHRLLQMGLSHYETVVVLYFIQCAYIFLAYLLRFHVDAVVLSAFALYSLTLLAVIQLALRGDWVRRHSVSMGTAGALLTGPFRQISHQSRLNNLLQVALVLVVPAYSLYAVFSSDLLSPDIGVLAVMLALMMAVNIAAPSKRGWLDAIGMYTACALIAYLGYQPERPAVWLLATDWFLVLLLGVAVWLSVMATSHRMFETSPLDFLVILLTILVPLLFGQFERHAEILLAVVKFIVLLYAFEYIRHGDRLININLIRAVLMVCLGVIGLGAVI